MAQIDIEKRLTDLEAIFTDLPELINLRLERYDASFADINARLNLLDRLVATLTRDLREMRAAVTRQLLGFDERLREVEAKLGAMEAKLGAMEAKLGAMETKLTAHDGRFDELNAKLDEVLRRLPKST